MFIHTLAFAALRFLVILLPVLGVIAQPLWIRVCSVLAWLLWANYQASKEPATKSAVGAFSVQLPFILIALFRIESDIVHWIGVAWAGICLVSYWRHCQKNASIPYIIRRKNLLDDDLRKLSLLAKARSSPQAMAEWISFQTWNDLSKEEMLLVSQYAMQRFKGRRRGGLMWSVLSV